MTTQPEALRLADELDADMPIDLAAVAAELRRLHAQRDALLEALKEVMQIYKNASVVVGPMIKMNRVANQAVKTVEGEKK